MEKCVILIHVKASINALKKLKITFEEVPLLQNLLKDMTLSKLSFAQIAFQVGKSHPKDFSKYVAEQLLSSAVFGDNFL